MKNFIEDERAVSPILGFILVAAIGISIITSMQVYSVPVWNTEIEFDHMNTVYEDMMHVASDIEDVAISGVPKSCVIPLGLEYPNRAIFSNPRPGMVGTLNVVSDNNITITYTNKTGTHTKTYPSCSIRYTAFGSAMYSTIVYEHGIVIRDHGEYGNSTTCEQTLISDDNINLVMSNGSYSASSVEPGSLTIYYNSSGSETVSEITEVNITMTTNYPDIWDDLLEGTNTTNTTVCVSGNKIFINNTAIEELSLPEMDSSFSGIYADVARFRTEKSATGGGGSGYENVTIALTADPTRIPANGVTTSEITATVTSEGSPAQFVCVGFGVTPTTYSVMPSMNIADSSGVAKTVLNWSTTAGLATVYATVGTVYNTVVVEFVEPAEIAWDDFESGCWNGGTGWLFGWYHTGGKDAAIRTQEGPHNGTYHLRLRHNGYVDRAVNLSGRSDVHLQFWAKAKGFESGDTAECLVSPDDVNWTVVRTWVDGEDGDVYRFENIDLSSFSMTDEFWIAFDAKMNQDNDKFFVDDIRIVSTYLFRKNVPPTFSENLLGAFPL